MVKQPLQTKATFKLPDSYQAPTQPCGSGKTRMLTAFLLNDVANNLELAGYKKVYLSRSKVGTRRVRTISNI